MITQKIKLHSGYHNLDELIIQKRSGKKTSREFLKNKDGVAALVYNKNLDKYILVSQWRPCLENYMTEIVAGSIELGETPQQAVEKEVLEEIGYKCDLIKYLTKCYVSPGVLSELIHIFYVEVSEKISDGGGLESELEEIDIVYMSKLELLNYEFIDAKSLLAINMMKL
jgi:nudix-type nucleoside diphosphatase (YffH/AdpP family)